MQTQHFIFETIPETAKGRRRMRAEFGPDSQFCATRVTCLIKKHPNHKATKEQGTNQNKVPMATTALTLLFVRPLYRFKPILDHKAENAGGEFVE